MNRTLFFVLSALLVTTGCAAGAEPSDDESTDVAESELIRGGLGAEGDSCTVRTNPDGTKVPGTEKGLECCSTANPTDCVVILKPFPGSFMMW
jgi:hypothetical protein